MCGILGYLSRSPLGNQRLQDAAELMKHRGPDADGFTHQGMAELGFRRLAIIDLTADGCQPMSNETADVWVVFNGEIYNFPELRRQLEPKHRFASHTDTEVLVHGYEEWGFEGLLRRIDGMFAFAIWDSRTEELWFARDRVGKKPLYYSAPSGAFAFASTLNSLLSLLPDTPQIDYVGLDQYLVYQALPAPRTIYEGVQMLPPAHFGRWKLGEPLKVDRYWQLSYRAKGKRSEEDLLEELDALLRDAIQRRLVADVPVGAFLSGGVDSSLIVAMMSQLGASPVEAINIGFEEAEFDERPFARQVAQVTKANLHECVLSPTELAHLPEIVWQYGQPLADVSIIPTFAVAREARKHVTVVLNGDGGDEGFAGYARPIVTRFAQTLRKGLPGPLRGAARSAAYRLGRRGRLLGDALDNSARESFRYLRGAAPQRDYLYSAEFLGRIGDSPHPEELYRQLWDAADGPTDADRALYGEFASYLPDQLLVKMDVSTMAHSVEARSPLLDRHVLEFAAGVPVGQLTRGFKTKTLLKRLAERYVPREVVYRRKRGFVMPAAYWLRGPLAGTLRSLLDSLCRNRGLFNPECVNRLVDEHQSGRCDHTDVIWTLLVLELWFQICVDGTLGRTDLLDLHG